PCQNSINIAKSGGRLGPRTPRATSTAVGGSHGTARTASEQARALRNRLVASGHDRSPNRRLIKVNPLGRPQSRTLAEGTLRLYSLRTKTLMNSGSDVGHNAGGGWQKSRFGAGQSGRARPRRVYPV